MSNQSDANGSAATEAPQQKAAKWFRSRRLWVSLLILAVAAGGVGTALALPKPAREQPAVKVAPVNVEVMRIVPQDRYVDSFELTGVIEPNRVVKVSAEVAGRRSPVSRSRW